MLRDMDLSPEQAEQILGPVQVGSVTPEQAAQGGRADAAGDLDLSPSEAVRAAYARGLELHEQGRTGEGLEPITVQRARALAAGERVTPEWARKAARWWARNARFLDEPDDSPAYASAMLWGGRPGQSWYETLSRQLEAADEAAER